MPRGEPPLDALQLRLLPIADFFMALMWSRPGGLSLRTTWVTPATLGLGVAVAVIGGLAGLVGLGFGVAQGAVLVAVGGLLALTIAAGAAIVACYGMRQRLLARARS